MEYQATTKYIRMSPRKIRLLAGVIRGMRTEVVLSKLRATNQPVAKLFMTTLSSAIANAKAKQGDVQKLWIKTVDVMEGPVMKRWHAVSRGMAHPYKKRMAHLRIVLTDEGGKINKSTNKQISK